MKMRTSFQRVLVSGFLLAALQAFSLQDAAGVQNDEGGAQSGGLVSISQGSNAKSAVSANEEKFPKQQGRAADSVDRVPMKNLQKIEGDKITSFFVRANDSKRIQLSMLVAYKAELTEAVRQIFGQKVTPLVFSVSTLPNRSVQFDPTQLRFEQRGRIWQPESGDNAADFLPLDEDAKFGGTVTDGQVHQGIVLLPAWINPKEPVTVRYGDFHYLARFADFPPKTAGDK
jgi:hypothetical protein